MNENSRLFLFMKALEILICRSNGKKILPKIRKRLQQTFAFVQ
ncbi:hypothetical protein X808_6680 [Mannheimia varigena USDA-ARS-USMARC-1296]|uniref:Uncharacterized protein n=1 Tax=Mannheimia varigena USDA-ARS-USMARC-1296 TaxID=1433287 RepID=W0Q9K6_9PAST|nr:hypothetical protein X808_6680 [Mannheimia varigena USDA-ARS-USMARC-1296]